MDKTFSSPYLPLWNKYRPVLLKMMVDAQANPQEYKLFMHEVKSPGVKEKKGLAFTFKAFHGKPLSTLKDSVIANDLLYVLTLSKKASELMEQHTYQFTLTRDYRLQIALAETL